MSGRTKPDGGAFDFHRSPGPWSAASSIRSTSMPERITRARRVRRVAASKRVSASHSRMACLGVPLAFLLFVAFATGSTLSGATADAHHHTRVVVARTVSAKKTTSQRAPRTGRTMKTTSTEGTSKTRGRLRGARLHPTPPAIQIPLTTAAAAATTTAAPRLMTTTPAAAVAAVAGAITRKAAVHFHTLLPLRIEDTQGTTDDQPAELPPCDPANCIHVIGLQRSGTTLLQHLLRQCGACNCGRAWKHTRLVRAGSAHALPNPRYIVGPRMGDARRAVSTLADLDELFRVRQQPRKASHIGPNWYVPLSRPRFRYVASIRSPVSWAAAFCRYYSRVGQWKVCQREGFANLAPGMGRDWSLHAEALLHLTGGEMAKTSESGNTTLALVRFDHNFLEDPSAALGHLARRLELPDRLEKCFESQGRELVAEHVAGVAQSSGTKFKKTRAANQDVPSTIAAFLKGVLLREKDAEAQASLRADWAGLCEHVNTSVAAALGYDDCENVLALLRPHAQAGSVPGDSEVAAAAAARTTGARNAIGSGSNASMMMEVLKAEEALLLAAPIDARTREER